MNRTVIFAVVAVAVGALAGSVATAHVFRSTYGAPGDQQARQLALVATSLTADGRILPADEVKARTLELLSMQMVLVAPHFDGIAQPALKARVLALAADEDIGRSLVGTAARTAARCIARHRTMPVADCLQANATPSARG